MHRETEMSLHAQQGGQALVETLVVLTVLGSLWLGIAWLGRLQDVGLQLAHASRRAAFAHAHQGLAPAALGRAGDAYLDAPGHRWRTRQGQDFLGDEARLNLASLGAMTGRQAGDPVAGSADLRRELRLGDPTVWRAVARVETAGAVDTTGALHDFDRLGLGLSIGDVRGHEEVETCDNQGEHGIHGDPTFSKRWAANMWPPTFSSPNFRRGP